MLFWGRVFFHVRYAVLGSPSQTRVLWHVPNEAALAANLDKVVLSLQLVIHVKACPGHPFFYFSAALIVDSLVPPNETHGVLFLLVRSLQPLLDWRFSRLRLMTRLRSATVPFLPLPPPRAPFPVSRSCPLSQRFHSSLPGLFPNETGIVSFPVPRLAFSPLHRFVSLGGLRSFLSTSPPQLRQFLKRALFSA